MLFAHLKRTLRLGRLRLRGPAGAQFEFTLQQSLRTFVALPSWCSIHPTRPRQASRKWRPSRWLRQVSVPGRLRSPCRAGGREIASPNSQISAPAESVDPADFCNKIGHNRTSKAHK
jgi:hypothetical protein